MSVYTTKFSLRDTVYLLDSEALNLVSAVVTDIYIHDTSLSNVLPTYKIKFYTDRSGKTIFTEDSLYFLEEGKAALLSLMSARTADIGSLR